MSLVIIDWIILVVIGLSAVISILRGFVREALSLAGWITAYVVARLFVDQLAYLLSSIITTAQWRVGIAFVVLFVATLICFALLNHLMKDFLRMTGLSGLDRILGMFFGIIRGLIFMVVVLSLGRMFALDQLWGQSEFVSYFDPIIKWVDQLVPQVSSLIINAGQ